MKFLNPSFAIGHSPGLFGQKRKGKGAISDLNRVCEKTIGNQQKLEVFQFFHKGEGREVVEQIITKNEKTLDHIGKIQHLLEG